MVKNREVFQVDPLSRDIPNGGVTKVLVPRTEQEWQVLRYELASFVCDGEYHLGLERILSTYIAHLGQAEQPAAWVSGFYGSGKSHLVRVLEYQWRDVVFPDGASARGITQLPDDINDLLKELTTIGKQHGGLWSAAGTLGAGAGKSVRLAMLGILFRSAGLPEQYAPARLVIWLRQNGYYDQVKAAVEAEGRDFFRELNNMYVSRSLADGLLAADPAFAGSNIEARNLLKAQYPNRDDVSDEELLLTMEDVLALQSTTPGKLPLTLLVFDELQQFIGEDSGRTLQVQTIVEACSARFGSRLLFVATGQAALQATPQLSKLQGRFTVRVTLSDTDVERVVRQVVLRKRENMRSVIQSTLQSVSGEIDRQLAGTKIGPRPTDGADLVPDYPLLPVQRRFWEAVLRAVDRPGTAGQLRTQLRIVHEAARHVANDPVGVVVAGDFIYDQQRQEMLQSGVLLRETDIAISELRKNGDDDGSLRSRLCALIFLISKLPTEGVAATGIEATPNALADLLVEDLVGGSTDLRQRIPKLLNDLVEEGTIMQVGNEYRLQTRESAEWVADFRGRHAGISADDGRIADERAKEFKAA
ncbi:MAG: BREX system P-loop protein BrxC, partial [Caldilineaceae bacterium]|nr:BREX system P-loop protein BrxC [Caldilineaceae bacterium]